jgi:glycosyltransferase A (GT-A) superfamily protein (DUF2064 family)
LSDRPTVLLMARAPRRGEVLRALEPVLGADRCRELQIALIELVAAWARGVTSEPLYVAHDPPDAGDELRVVLGGRATLFPQNGQGIAARLADASARLFSHGHGPLLIVWPDLLRWRPDHAAGALYDLEQGCDLSLGPVFDGGLYLLAIARPLPELFALPEQTWRSPDAMTVAVAAAQHAGLEIGILRTERALHRPADVRAALADPLLAPELVPIINANLGTGRGGAESWGART